MKIFVLSRKGAEERIYGDWDYVISITDKLSPPANIRANHLLRLTFDDVLKYTRFGNWDLVPMSEYDAERVAKFAKSIPQGATLYVHCEMGISRSAGVAAAIALYFNGHDQQFWGAPYRPNRTCYNLVLNKLKGVVWKPYGTAPFAGA